MSLAVSPSPSPLSGSLLSIDTSLMLDESGAVTVAVIGTILWFGGHRMPGFSLTEIAGGVASLTVIVLVFVVWLPALSVATNVHVVVPGGKIVPVGPVVGFVM